MSEGEEQSRELVILVGMPGSGKTTYCQTHLADYRRLSQDEGPRTFGGVLQALEILLAKGERRIVIDRTNPDRAQRLIFAQAARRRDYRVRIIYFDIARQACQDRIAARSDHPTLEATKMNEAIAAFLSRLDPPATDECDELIVVKPAVDQLAF